MKKISAILAVAFLSIGCGIRTTPNAVPNEPTNLETDISFAAAEPKPYEAIWLELSKVDSGYVVYNYPNLWGDEEAITPTSITVRNDSLIWETYAEPAARLSLREVVIEKRENGSYFFPVGNKFLFTWYDRENHIVQWTIYFRGKPLSNNLYIDSRYNTFPIVEYKRNFSGYMDE